MTKSPTELLIEVLSEAQKRGEHLRIWDCKVIYDLSGEYETKLTEVAGDPQKVIYLACEMAHEALMAERNRVGEIVGGAISEDQPDDDFARGWQAAGDAIRVELWDIQPWSGPLAENDNEGDQPSGAA